jgi:hypothetical protein
VAGLLQSTTGYIVGIFHQYACRGKGSSIHSSNQLRHFGVDIDDCPRTLSGKQAVATLEGYTIPLKIQKGLAVMPMSVPTSADLEAFPHVLFTFDITRDPIVLDDDHPECDWQFPPPEDIDPRVNCFGNIICCKTLSTQQNSSDGQFFYGHFFSIFDTKVTKNENNVDKLKPFFAFLPSARIKGILDNTTKFARASIRLPM